MSVGAGKHGRRERRESITTIGMRAAPMPTATALPETGIECVGRKTSVSRHMG